LLFYEFGFHTVKKRISPPKQLDHPPNISNIQVSDYLFLRIQKEKIKKDDLVPLLAPIRILTPFYKPIVGETKKNIIIVSIQNIKKEDLIRILRHEIGHLFNLNEHLNCVMSPYAVEEPVFCSECISKIRSYGIEWKPIILKGRFR